MESMKTAQAAIADANENVDRRIDQIEMRVKGVSLVCKLHRGHLCCNCILHLEIF